MRYYKLIDADKIIGVCSSYDLRKHQAKHDILLTSDEDSAQYIQYENKLYRDEWFKKLSTDKFDYAFVRIIVIDEHEYNILVSAMQTGEEISVTPEENQEIIDEPIIDKDTGITVDYIKAVKIAEMSSVCNKIITNGFDIILSDGESHHFSLTIQDQLNLITLSTLVTSGDTTIPYHADGELCKYYSADDIGLIIEMATSFKTYHVTYYNSLKSYIESLETIEEIYAIEYGIVIPEDYQSDILKMLISQMQGE